MAVLAPMSTLSSSARHMQSQPNPYTHTRLTAASFPTLSIFPAILPPFAAHHLFIPSPDLLDCARVRSAI
jgi:hypothetical protein